MLRELTSLAEMFFKEAKAWLAASLFFAVMLPIAFVFGFSYIVRGPAIYYLISGMMVFDVAVTGMLVVPNSIGWDREDGRLSLMISMGVPLWAYALTSTLVNNLFAIGSGLLVLGVAVAMRYLAVSLSGLAMLILALLVSSFQGSMVGLLIASRIRNLRVLQQVTQIVAFGFSFFAPVYFPLSVVPRYLLPFAMLEPTTYAAQAIRLSLRGSPASLVWDLGTVVYGAVIAAIVGRLGLKA
ncbi:MAG: ABC-2 type transporter [uncultured Acidilobus sp. MG]|nr:MAG: ABC-2 type transporter [uncultured Acidilobus sp. MG]